MIWIASVIAVITFLLIPNLGTLRNKQRWRKFRNRVMCSSLHPSVKSQIENKNDSLGMHRFLGRIEAIYGDDTFLVKGDGVTVRVKMADAEIYFLPSKKSAQFSSHNDTENRLTTENLKRVSWKSITSIQEGAQLYISGFLDSSNNLLTMYGTKKLPPLVLLHEGDDVIPRAIWSGRNYNDYWNALTPWSFLAGSLALFIMSSIAYRSDELSSTAKILLTVALTPVLPLLPPGIVFTFLYLSRLLRLGFLKAERDLVELCTYLRKGLRHDETLGWGEDIPHETTELMRDYQRKIKLTEIISYASLYVGYVINIILVAIAINTVT